MSRKHWKKANHAVSQRTPDHTEFGPNEWLVDELHQQYLTDKNSVDPAWWEFFADYQPSDTPNGQSHQSGRAQEPNGPPSSRPAPSRPPETAAPFPAGSVPAPTPPAQNGASSPVPAPTQQPAAPMAPAPAQAPDSAPSAAPSRPSTPLPRDIPPAPTTRPVTSSEIDV